jgi:hypothetical protein
MPDFTAFARAALRPARRDTCLGLPKLHGSLASRCWVRDYFFESLLHYLISLRVADDFVPRAFKSEDREGGDGGL